MKKSVAGIFAGFALSISMGVVADQSIPDSTLAQFRKEIQQQSDTINLSQKQSEALLKLKTDLYRHNRNVEAVHGHDEHSMRVLSQANQDRYDAAFAELLTKKQQKAVRDYELAQLRKQVPADFMNRYEKQVKEKGKVMRLSKAERQALLEMKMHLYTQQQAANRKFPHDREARNAARRTNREAYNARFEQMTTQKQREALQKWRRAQRNA
ncbi:hypothetical protein [Endozoicomonas lisbonensis]|uniref:Protein required for attachment to host cells n=1 Tax=Endozoicomonas lisbonensis TaxID=3120522 RepID=A0ABV2SCY0_9GAMM